MEQKQILSTTVLCVRLGNSVAMGSDGQVTLGSTVMKSSASKIRTMRQGKVLAGFAGASADALALVERFEANLERYSGNLPRATVELAKEWRTDKLLRRLEALLVVADKDNSFLISGTGDVIEPDDGICAIGSGGPLAISAARALIKHTDLTAKQIVEESLQIVSEICIYTNQNLTIVEL